MHLMKHNDLDNIPPPDYVHWAGDRVYLIWDAPERYRLFTSFVNYFARDYENVVENVEFFSHAPNMSFADDIAYTRESVGGR